MFKPEDISQIKARGSQAEAIEQQIENFKTGFPYLKLSEAASNYHGIIKLSESEIQKYISIFEEKNSNKLELIKFVPASGAASRMFKSLFSALDNLRKGKTTEEIMADKEVALFFNQLNQFAFYEDLQRLATSENKSVEEIPAQKILEWVLLEEGLNYGNLPKALLKFHRYPDQIRTPLEEHFVEGAMYSKNSSGTVILHFTVSTEHQQAMEQLVAELKPKYEELFGVTYAVSFSNQKPSTDTVAVTPDNELFRNKDNSLLFRPAGHGALLDNLNDLDADIVFIKNIDNVVPEQLNQPTIDSKKALAGILISIQEQIFHYQKILKENYPSTLESGFYAELANYLENVLNTTPPQNQYYSEKEELYHYFSKKMNRPVRVCGMVKNQGEPGGGPFFAMNNDGSVSLQIVESSQIDFSDPTQAALAQKATHFNPVDLVCGIKNYEGKKYNLLEFSDPKTGLITTKSSDGKELKAQELPGLWNGSMSDWNTLFVEVPIETFNPVKTVNDLLRKEHQAK
ncbi:ribosylnicotinamide kinase homolog [Aquipluma nitroreducens]|uniref:Ribosylnicotinamide kinase homolog n=1 Tax=Aquipluma nitroreducens TaxID=2010828 RepID=A0A5K7S3B4_9BACT|nr:DUF4301 family protein [Aquipluma nitroreducens]BBE15970.1 ribosylnicotinamide kinase homolog [Aquipluma nitroreducens]